MKLLLGFVLIVGLSGCIPIGLQGRTSASDAPDTLAAAATPRSAAVAVGL
jgi:hypothetical protein